MSNNTIYIKKSSRLDIYQVETIFHLVAGTGFEPATSGL